MFFNVYFKAVLWVIVKFATTTCSGYSLYCAKLLYECCSNPLASYCQTSKISDIFLNGLCFFNDMIFLN